jgi:hypothetical protein
MSSLDDINNLMFTFGLEEMLHNQARETHALLSISYPVQSHPTAALPFPSHSLTPAHHLLAPPKYIKTNPSNSDVGISSLNTFRPETLTEMPFAV